MIYIAGIYLFNCAGIVEHLGQRNAVSQAAGDELRLYLQIKTEGLEMDS